MQWIPCITIYAASHPDSFNDVAVPNLTQFLKPSQRLKVELYLPRQDTPTIIQGDDDVDVVRTPTFLDEETTSLKCKDSFGN